MADALVWLESTPYFRLLHERHFAARDLHTWAEELVGDLVASGAAARQDDLLLNA